MNINEIELACNLATIKTVEDLVGTEIYYSNEEDLFTEDESGTQIWKEEPQRVFNDWYDYYLGEIEKCKI